MMRPLIADNFAGGGGASTGIEAATGRAIDVAINHDAEAVAMHAANHPATLHLCNSILSIDPLEAINAALAANGGDLSSAADWLVGLAWFSPDCKHHSKAKGGKPREKNIRDLAWVVVHWIERLQEAWSRIGRDKLHAVRCIMLENVEEFRRWGPLDEAGMPIRDRQGEEFDLFVRRIRRRGGRVEFRELRACDYGAPTSRKRLYMIVRFDGEPIVWPEPTHGKPGTPEVDSSQRLPWRTAAECIDWSIPCPSIFDRARPLKDATNHRIAHGVMRYVVNAARPFIVPLTHHGSADRSYSVDDPFVTITGAHRGELATVDAAIVPITHTQGGNAANDPAEPLRTITTAKGGEFARATVDLAPVIVGCGGRRGQSGPVDPAGPYPTTTAKADACLVVAHMEKFSENSRGKPADAPLDAVMAGAPRHAAVTAFLSQFYSSNRRASGGDPLEPARSITAEGQHHAVVCAHMEQANTGMVGHPATRPLSTIVGRGTTQRLVTTTMVDADALPPDQLDRAVQVAAFLIKYYGAAQHGQAADEPLHAVTAKPRFAVVTVTIDAITYVIVDIGMRMLSPRELANAQGFPASYILDAIGPNGKPLTKTAQIRMIGNSVCPAMSEALVRANLPDLCETGEAIRAAA